LSPVVQVIHAVTVAGQSLQIPEHAPPDLAALMRSCMATDVRQRPSFAQALDSIAAMQAQR
jgi:hypothetical protein